ncbi:MAG: hypothetical protein V5A43_11010, partial [Haloarculaceae archaeon]
NSLRVSRSGGEFDLSMKTYATDTAGLGSVIMPHIDGVEEYYLTSGTLEAFSVSRSELDQFLQMEEVPVHFDGELRWSSELFAEEL